MSKITDISDVLEIVTQRTEAALIADSTINFGTMPKKVYFMHGHPKEILGVLQSFTTSPTKKNQKYPLICLFRDIKEKLSEGQSGLTTASSPRIVICTLTSPSLRAEDRKVKNFDPILTPILLEFINQIRESEFFGSPTMAQLSITKWNRYFWGTESADKLILNDHIDAIEIESINLNLVNTIC